jgi:adenine specific DNA methylase Mod
MKVAEKIKTHILCSKIFSENRAVYEIIWKNIIQPDKPQMTVQYGTCTLLTR